MGKKKPIHISVKILIMFAMLITSSQMLVKASIANIKLLNFVNVTHNGTTTEESPHDIFSSAYNTTITLTGGEVFNVDLNILDHTKKYGYLQIPTALHGKVGFQANQSSNVNTSISLLYNEISLIGGLLGPNGLLGLAVSAVNTAIDLGSYVLGNSLVDLQALSFLLNELVYGGVDLTGASFQVEFQDLTVENSYLAVPLDEGIGTIVVNDLIEILELLQSTLDRLSSKGVGAVLLLVTVPLNNLISRLTTILSGSELDTVIDQIADAAVLGSTIVTMPITINSHTLTTSNGRLEADFYGSLLQTALIEIDLLSYGEDYTTVYLSNEVPTAPRNLNILGYSNTPEGYTLTGEATPGDNVIVRGDGISNLTPVVADSNGTFTIVIPHPMVQGSTISVTAKRGGLESPATTHTIPFDPIPTLPTNVLITGNSAIGYTITGNGKAGESITILDDDNNVLTSILMTTTSFTYNLPLGTEIGDEIKVYSSISGFNSNQVTTLVPADPTIAVPTVTGLTGNSIDGYQITGTGEIGQTIVIRNSSGLQIGSGLVDSNGEFEITFNHETAVSNHLITVRALENGIYSEPVSRNLPSDPVIETPANLVVTGNSVIGYVLTGTGRAGDSIVIFDNSGNSIPIGQTVDTSIDQNGNFEFALPSSILPSQILRVSATKGGFTSDYATTTVPNDPVIATPTNLRIVGNTVIGHGISGLAEANRTINAYDSDNLLVGTTTTNVLGEFTVSLNGTVTVGDTIYLESTDGTFFSAKTNIVIPQNPTITPPVITSVTGNSITGYTITGTSIANYQLEVENADEDTLKTVTVMQNNIFTFTLDSDDVSPGEELTIYAVHEGLESTKVFETLPADPVITKPYDLVVIGNSVTNYSMEGKGTFGDTITVKLSDNSVVGTGTVDANGNFDINLANGVTQGSILSVVASKGGFSSLPATIVVEDDPIIAAPTNVQITGNTLTGYTVTGRGTVGDTIIITNSLDEEVGNAVVDANGNFTVQISGSEVSPLEILDLVSERNGLKSASQEVEVPANPVVTAPSNLSFSGNTLDGLTLRGKGTPGDTIIIRTALGTQLGTTQVNQNGDFEYALQVGSVQQQDILKLIATRDGFSSPEVQTTVPNNPLTPPTAPGNVTIDGNSTDGYIIEGEGVAGETIIVRDSDGNEIGRTTVQADGTFEVSIDPEDVDQGEILDVVSEKDGIESTPVEVEVPTDPGPLVNPLITQLGPITGNSTNGYAVQGLTTDANSVIVTDSQGNVVAIITVNARTRSIILGQFTAMLTDENIEPGELLTFTAYNDLVKGNEMKGRVPFDSTQPTVPNPPTDVNIDGNEDDGYVIDGGGTPGDTIIVTDKDGNTIGETIVDEDGRFEVIVKPGVVKPGDKLNVVSDRDGIQSEPIVIQVPNGVSKPLPGTGVSSNIAEVSLLITMIGLLLILVQKRREIERNF